MEETYGFEVHEPCFSKRLNGRDLIFTRLADPELIDPYLDVFQEIWGLDDRGRIPVHEPISIVRAGGLFLGVDLDGERVGFVYVFAAKLPVFGFHHHSNIMGFLEPYRNLGLALEAKRVHAIIARRESVGLITWTFDPLQAANANLNFRKLGCICRTYHENAYGYLGGHFDSGLPTDRFWVEWYIDSERVKKRLSGRIPDSSEVWERFSDAPIIEGPDEKPENRVVRIELPDDVHGLASHDLEKARKSQDKFRYCIKSLLLLDYTATNLVSIQNGPERRNFYILQKDYKL